MDSTDFHAVLKIQVNATLVERAAFTVHAYWFELYGQLAPCGSHVTIDVFIFLLLHEIEAVADGDSFLDSFVCERRGVVVTEEFFHLVAVTAEGLAVQEVLSGAVDDDVDVSVAEPWEAVVGVGHVCVGEVVAAEVMNKEVSKCLRRDDEVARSQSAGRCGMLSGRGGVWRCQRR